MVKKRLFFLVFVGTNEESQLECKVAENRRRLSAGTAGAALSKSKLEIRNSTSTSIVLQSTTRSSLLSKLMQAHF